MGVSCVSAADLDSTSISDGNINIADDNILGSGIGGGEYTPFYLSSGIGGGEYTPFYLASLDDERPHLEFSIPNCVNTCNQVNGLADYPDIWEDCPPGIDLYGPEPVNHNLQ